MLKRIFWTMLAVAVTAVGNGKAEDKAAPEPPPASGDVATWVDARVDKLRPTAEDKRFDEVGWSREVVAAQDLAKQHRRPVFLFTHDGRMNEGRC